MNADAAPLTSSRRVAAPRRGCHACSAHRADDRMMTIDDVSLYLRTPKSTLYSLRSEGRGPVGRRVGRNLRFRRRDIDDWFNDLPTTKGEHK